MLLYPHSFAGIPLLLSATGSAIPRAVIPAFCAFVLTTIIEETISQEYLNHIFAHPYPYTIFANLEQGDIAKSEDLIEAFGTDNEDVVCVEVLNKGEFQVSEEERQAQVEQLFKDVAARVTDMCVNPETQ